MSNETRDTTERLGADDMATVREEEFRQIALSQAKRDAELSEPSTPGICANCNDDIPPPQVYCSPDCRADHGRRIAARKRAGLPVSA